MNWQPIDTAPVQDEPIFLAAFDANGLLWACAAEWMTWAPGTVQCASASGWAPLLPMVQENLSRNQWVTLYGRIGGEFPPTHWAPIGKLNGI